jgi:hypothetical protein
MKPHPYDIREAKYLMIDLLELLARYNKLTCKSLVIHDPSETLLPAITADEIIKTLKEENNVRKPKSK